jgi:hypothetical protein
MARPGGPTVEIELTREERETLQLWVRRHTSSQALALRCRIVLGCAGGGTNTLHTQTLGDRVGGHESKSGRSHERTCRVEGA